MQGMADGKFYPANPVTRGQVAQIFYRLLKDRNVTSSTTFADVPDTLWCAEAVNTLAALDIVRGIGNGQFAPNQPITRAQFVTVTARMLGWDTKTTTASSFTDTKGHWAEGAISAAVQHGALDKGGSFRPDAAISREDMAHLLEPYYSTKPDGHGLGLLIVDRIGFRSR